MIPLKKVRNYFPIFSDYNQENKFVYLDNAATTFCPESVLDSWKLYYETKGGTPGRGNNILNIIAENDLDNARQKIKAFFGCTQDDELIFVQNATDALNLAAHGLSNIINETDTILVSAMEHHSNYLPWIKMAQACKANIEVLPILENGEFDYDLLADYLNNGNVKIIALTHTSNVTGYQPKLSLVSELAKRSGALLVLDGVQAAGHQNLDFSTLGVSLMAVSAHKMYGPKNIGGLIGKKETLDLLYPYKIGGGTIYAVNGEEIILGDIPSRFEAGTIDVASAIAWAQACIFMQRLDMSLVINHEKSLYQKLTRELEKMPLVKILPPGECHAWSIISFTIEEIHSHELSVFLNNLNIAIRTGHFCAQPLMEQFKIHSANRVSLSMYTSSEDIEYFIESLHQLI